MIDLREPAEFHAKHILGARNIPSTQLKLSLAALRKDKPILLYENSRSSRVTNAALFLKKKVIQTFMSCLMVLILGMEGKVQLIGCKKLPYNSSINNGLFIV